MLGVASISYEGTDAEIEGLWVSPDAMGQGVGRALFEEIIRRAKAKSAILLHIASDPQAAGFYTRMGAIQNGTVPSRPEGRVLPLLSLKLER